MCVCVFVCVCVCVIPETTHSTEPLAAYQTSSNLSVVEYQNLHLSGIPGYFMSARCSPGSSLRVVSDPVVF